LPALAALRIKGVHAASTLLEIARLTLRADVALAAGAAEEALAPLTRAVMLEDGLAPDEPHLWLAPARQALGSALLQASRPADAALSFAQDLRHYPDNGWSLLGLAQAQRALHQRAAAAATASRFAAAWRDADIALAAPRL
jgi:predicted Zn-dependent protease